MGRRVRPRHADWVVLSRKSVLGDCVRASNFAGMFQIAKDEIVIVREHRSL
jgi:hypothetical protein